MTRSIKGIALVLALTGLAGLNASALADEKLLKETDVEMVAIKVARETVEGGYGLLTVTDLKAMKDAGEDLVLIDAHPREEFVVAYVKGATNFGFQSNRVGVWEDDIAIEGGATQDDYRAALGPDKDKKIVIYCGFTKCGRSHNAAMWAQSLGYTNVFRVPGGITAWRDAGYPFEVIETP